MSRPMWAVNICNIRCEIYFDEGVYGATNDDIGLCTEAGSFLELTEKLEVMIPELMEENNG